MANKISTSIVLLTRREKDNGKYPAKLRVTYNRVQRYYGIDTKDRTYEFTSKEFEKITGAKPRGVYKEIQLEFSLMEEKARNIINRLQIFSFDDFKTLWGIKGTSSNVLQFYNDYYKYLDENQKQQRWNYQSAKKALQEFFKKEKYIDFREITPTKMAQFEKYMLDTGRKISTIATYSGTIRTIFKQAIKIQAISEDLYPFGRGKYIIPQVSNTKRALSTQEIKAIYEYQAEPFSAEDYAKDFWIFSYLGNGMNMVDICRLKYEDVEKDFFTFIRHKTKEKSKGLRTVSVPISNDIRKIMDKWGNKDKSPENYVFPFLTNGLTPKEIQYRVRYRVEKVNQGMKKISQNLGIERKLTTYSARHSFATKLKRAGISTEFIGESLGHFNLDITKRYLDSFENEQKKEIAKHLTTF